MIKGKNMIDYIFYGVTLTLFMVIAYIVNTFCLELKRIEKEQQALITNIIKTLEVINKNNEVLVKTINNIVCCIENIDSKAKRE